jgi:hypothetical protein
MSNEVINQSPSIERAKKLELILIMHGEKVL